MDVDAQQAPPVVAVVVAHEPGAWFDDTLAALAAQDYPNLKVLVLSTGSDDISARVRAVIPAAFTRSVGANPGFGSVANQVLRLVEGESGFFCFLHDDVALDSSSIRMLVEELYRSNAGIVGPKLVDWDDPGVLQHVGLAVDHIGAIDLVVEPGERDQEQHDAVRDVFALPSACLLVRADLFRSLGGFDPVIDFHGEDIDLCWRAHLSGARVVVVPGARGRHRGRLVERRPDLDHAGRRARHRMRAFATLTGGWRAVMRTPLLVFTTVAEFVTGIFSGRASEGAAGLRALIGLVPRLPGLLARRAAIRSLRVVPDSEVAELQIRGSARRTAHRRSREMGGGGSGAMASFASQIPREGSGVVIAGWLTLLVVLVVGARGIIAGGSQAVGQMLPFSARSTLLDSYWSGWWDTGVGQTAASPTGLAVIAVASTAVLGKMALLHTLGIVLALLAGYIGVWRLAAVLGGSRARLAATAAYAAVPLPYAAVGAGRWGVVATYAAVPWALHAIRRVSGWTVPSADDTGSDEIDIVVIPDAAERLRLSAGLVLVLGLGLAFVPAIVLVVLVAAVLWLLATVLVRGSVAAAAVAIAATIVGVVGAFVVNVPWSIDLLGGDAWDAVAGPSLASPRDIGLVDLAQFGIGPSPLAVVSLALYVTAVAAVLVTRGWRLGWAGRGSALVLGFLALAVLDDRGTLPVRMPEPGVLLVPVAVGLALCAGALVAGLATDVRGATFGVRQPLALLGATAFVVGLVPGLASALDGGYDQPSLTLVEQVDSVLAPDPPDGDYRVLYLGDPRVIPAAPLGYVDGIAYALVDDGPLTVADTWAGEPESQRRLVHAALDAIAARDTARVGRVLAPLAIRYIVVPVHDGVESTANDPIPLPDGLLDSLAAQIDLRRTYSPRDIVVFENTAWIPIRSVLSTGAAAASEEAGLGPLVRSDVSGSIPVMTGATTTDAVVETVPAGTFHLAVPVDERWRVTIDGEEVASRPAFGYSAAYELATESSVVLEYRTDGSRTLWVALQAGLWALTVLATTRVLSRLGTPRRHPVAVAGAPVIDLADETGAALPAADEPVAEGGVES